jgi:hypothetical protein
MYEDIKKAGFPMSFGQFHDMSPRFMVEGLVWLFLLASIGCSLYFLREIGSAFARLTPFRKLAKLLGRAFLWTPKMIWRQFGDFDTPTWTKGAGNLVTKFCPYFKAVILFPSC